MRKDNEAYYASLMAWQSLLGNRQAQLEAREAELRRREEALGVYTSVEEKTRTVELEIAESQLQAKVQALTEHLSELERRVLLLHRARPDLSSWPVDIAKPSGKKLMPSEKVMSR